jgi:hypothetical protein
LSYKQKKVIAEEQAGFRAGYSKTELIFNLSHTFNLCEKYLQYRRSVFYVFIDFKKALN